MENWINKSNISSIKVHTQLEHPFFKYLKEEKSFWSKREAGFYMVMGYETVKINIEEELKDSNYIVKDKRVYFKPHLCIIMNNKHCFEIFFESQEKLYLRLVEILLDQSLQYIKV